MQGLLRPWPLQIIIYKWLPDPILMSVGLRDLKYVTYPQTDKCNSRPQEPFKFRVWPLLWQPGLIMAPRASQREQHSGWVHYQVKWAQHPIYPMTLVWTVACAGNLNTKFSQQSESSWGEGQKDLKQHQKHLKKVTWFGIEMPLRIFRLPDFSKEKQGCTNWWSWQLNVYRCWAMSTLKNDSLEFS